MMLKKEMKSTKLKGYAFVFVCCLNKNIFSCLIEAKILLFSLCFVKIFMFLKYYFKFLWNSKNKHGVHSPFVYKLITQCFSKRLDVNYKKKIKDYKSELLRNNSLIQVTDFGAGSRVFSSDERKVSKIAKVAASSQKKTDLLCKISQYFQPENMLEIGTSLGMGTASLSIGNSSSKITTLEGCANTLKVAENLFHQFGLKNITTVQGNFDNTLPEVLQKNKWDLIFIDGNHTKKSTLNYFNLSLPNCHNDSIIIFDEIHWNKEMNEAWEEIRNHKSVTVSIDIFIWGIVFLRKEQEKEHFTIRV